MHTPKLAFFAFIVIAAIANSLAAATLTIGSVAPELDIEHWVQDGEGKFKPVTKFEEGKVYIVEFWATWCGPCIRFMPHLAELQQKYADKGVQLISVSNETLFEVTKFLERAVPGGDGQTFKELTKVYCLTADPDRSCGTDYMAAAGKTSIPTAFLVGKTGKIEWIGHPMDLEQPLEDVVADKWDRDAFLVKYKKQQEIEVAIMGAQKLAEAGDFAKAIEQIDQLLNDDLPDMERAQLMQMRPLYAIFSGSDAGLAELNKQAAEARDDWRANANVGIIVAKSLQESKQIPEDVQKQYIAIGISALEKAIEKQDKFPIVFVAYADLLSRSGDLEKAIEAQTKVVELSKGNAKVMNENLLRKMKSDLEKEKK
ncbi:MAG: redoxin domain-containing protein [Planctomycetales bacterium]|nr:redoxin domain-containing protein [Planctomycetales bacterium]